MECNKQKLNFLNLKLNFLKSKKIVKQSWANQLCFITIFSNLMKNRPYKIVFKLKYVNSNQNS